MGRTVAEALGLGLVLVVDLVLRVLMAAMERTVACC